MIIMYLILTFLDSQEDKLVEMWVSAILTIILLVIIAVFGAKVLFYFFEMAYVEYVKKQLFFNHIYIRRKRLSRSQKQILQNEVKFYQQLSKKHQSFFEHRLYKFIDRVEFIGNDIAITDRMRVIISATLVKLTFGLRDYQIESLERVIIYPDEFYSQTNKAYHKGEFNLGLKALVFSWKDVLHGYEIEDDNLNLAIHEFTHAIHFYYLKVRRRSTSAAIFLDAFVELSNMLEDDDNLKSKLVASNFLRDYAFTNQFEFIAVIVETFIETPSDFKKQFPRIYDKTREMLNFNFMGY
ncbi:zinc-dependent peptidase [Psychroserpens sp. Hel_I_66]|uniref:zinc-dependent peptidase n=1 Tax=Psychroserpens sp. Hel_I_66 TaxID=1250004 RepID=UPI0009DD10DF|nr:zinc-dependent peptidase [Psychroserpens sp. Hel_I_66]